MTETYHLEFCWGVSRGRDSYGYNICSLKVDGVKASSCNGGGYDMRGTVLGNWLARTFPKKLLRLRPEDTGGKPLYGLAFHDPKFDPWKMKVRPEDVSCLIPQACVGKTLREVKEKNFGVVDLAAYQAFYRASSPWSTRRHRVPQINGAYGVSSVERIGEAIGLKFMRLDRNGRFWRVTVGRRKRMSHG